MITCAVGWYLRFSLSYRDVEELLTERGLPADHTTIWRWVQRYAPEMNKRCRRELKPTNGWVNASQGFRSFHGARRTIQGYEVVHMIRKGQVRWLPKKDVLGLIRFLYDILGLKAE